MMKWSPWPPAVAAPRRKFSVKVKPLKLEGLDHDFWREKIMAVQIRWKGEPPKLVGFVLPFSSRSQKIKHFSREKIVKNGEFSLEWEDDEFENCVVFSSDGQRWDVSFSILCVSVFILFFILISMNHVISLCLVLF